MAMEDRRPGPKGTGDFFTIDHRLIGPLCDAGVNATLAYLVLAAGSGRDNATTAWSATALQKYCGIHHSRGKAAIQTLVDLGFVERLATGRTPRYLLRPAEAVQSSAAAPRPALDPDEQPAYDQLLAGDAELDPQIVNALIVKGWAWRAPDDAPEPRAPEPEPSLVWLPNALVTGVDERPSPLRALREAHDPLLLRLLLDLYGHQDLAGEGGISRTMLARSYERIEVGQQGPYVVWGFRPQAHGRWDPGLHAPHRVAATEADPYGIADVRHRLRVLADLGLVSWVPTLFDGPGPEAESIHVCGRGSGDDLDDRLGRAAQRAGRALLTENQRRWVDHEFGRDVQLVPLLRQRGAVEMAAIARLVFRPRTRATQAWAAERKRQEVYLEQYLRLAAAAVAA